MAETKQVLEEQILREIQTASSAQELSERLFSHSGLFSQLASTREERAALSETELFKAGLARFSELRKGSLRRFQSQLELQEAGAVTSSLRRAG